DSGAAALAAAEARPPDLVLLDVMMPDLDGYEVARRLKQSPQFLPVILVTALSDGSSRVRGLAAGADEFLSKPIDPRDLRLRMLRLLANLLDVTRNESAGLELRRESTQLADLVRPLVEQRVAILRARDVALEVEVDPRAAARVDSDLVSRVVENLLDNAARHV